MSPKTPPNTQFPVTLADIFFTTPAIPVLTVGTVPEAVELARALLSGGLRILEITLRTPTALDCVSAIRQALPEAVVGVGTVLQPDDLRRAGDAGARFAVSPGLTPELAAAGITSAATLLPGAVTASEIMAARCSGYRALKFFPAKTSGGLAGLKALAPVFPDVAFCPTGGLTLDDFRDFLALPNVFTTGGTWMMPAELVATRDWKAIEALARRTALG
jgi:2-dehydro-3-deoxyphosphogluconate aldolase/(4S)-4-hydroxy-2-oxoglutarate aldolase